MTAEILDGRPLAAQIRATVAEQAADFRAAHGRPPCLAAVLVGEDAASVAYANVKGRAAAKCGLAFRLERLAGDAGTEAVVAHIQALNRDPTVDAVLVELPLPAGYDRLRIEAAIDPGRDADGVTSYNQGQLLAGGPGPRPATAAAAMALLEAASRPIAGAEAVVVGRSVVVGKPVALLLLAQHATVTIAHTRTRDLAAVTRRADILIAAAGVAGLITGEHVRAGAVVIDVGTNQVGEGEGARLVGDVDFESAAKAAAAITPVPGGVGPVTTAILLQNAVALAEARAGGPPANADGAPREPG